MRWIALALLCFAAAACTNTDAGADTDASTGTDAGQADGARAEAARDVTLTPGGASEVPPAAARHFDPGALRADDRFGGLRVVAVDVRRVFDDSVWAGRVQFAGELRVTGVYQRHFDWPEPEALCFHVDDAAVGAVPAFAPDSWTSPGMKVWFCFTNPEHAQALLGSAGTPLHATIVIDDYQVMREFTDAFDTARLVRVEDARGPATRTLRDR